MYVVLPGYITRTRGLGGILLYAGKLNFKLYKVVSEAILDDSS